MNDYDRAVEPSFNAGKKHMDLLEKCGVPRQVYTAFEEGEGWVGACIPIEQANPMLAPYNLTLRLARQGKWYVLGVLDPERVWPTNWFAIADEIVMSGQDHPKPRFGRKKWLPIPPGGNHADQR